MINVTTAPMSELIAFYNAHNEVAVKRFADRKTAERRVTAMLDSLAPTLLNELNADAAEMGLVDRAALPKVIVLAPAPVAERRHANRSAAIAATWANPEVAAKRQERTAVRVMKKDGKSEEWFKSTAAAFRALRLPLQGHIKFRMALKAAGQLEFTNGKDVWLFTTDDGNGNMVAKPGRVPAKVSKRKTLGAELAQVAAKSVK